MKKQVLLTLVWLGVFTSFAVGETVDMDMQFYGQVGQTSVYRSDVTFPGIGSILSVDVTDNMSLRGSTGVFSGFDLDFIFFDADGDLATAYDRVFPRLDGSTYVTPGIVANAATSPYQPTELHPGPLFGLNAEAGIDFATATPRRLDASYTAGPGFGVDVCNGWATVGDGGSFTAGFPLFTTSQYQEMYIFIGDAGPAEEAIGANVQVHVFDAFELYFMSPFLSMVMVDENDNISLDASFLAGYGVTTYYSWDLDGDGEFDDAVGADPIFPYEFLLEMGLSPGGNEVSLMISPAYMEEGDIYDVTLLLTTPIPEPASISLLAVCGAMMLRRRRRKK